MVQKEATPLQFLSGWKEIANYLRKGVRTVQRYERELGLPVHRPAGKPAGYVIATKSELDGWVNAGPIRGMPRSRIDDHRVNRIRADFLLIDSEIALTFAGMALHANDPEKRRRTTQTAQKAYDTIMRMREHVDLGPVERKKLDANLQRLKAELRTLGQTV